MINWIQYSKEIPMYFIMWFVEMTRTELRAVTTYSVYLGVSLLAPLRKAVLLHCYLTWYLIYQ